MSDINVVPLVDVMLVLLVIFIITAPLLTHAVKIDLPKASSQPNLTKPECEISCESEAFWGLQTGAQNPIELLMNGKIKIAGEAQIPMALSSLFV